MKFRRHLRITAILFMIGAAYESHAQNIAIDISANPIPNLAIANFGDSDARVFSGSFEFGEPYLAGANVAYTPPVCLLFDYAEIYDATAWAIRLGFKRYFGTKSRFYLRGTSTMWSFGAVKVKTSDDSAWGAVVAGRVGYKFLPFGRLIAEPFYEFAYAWSKAFEPDLTNISSLGVNLGFRLVRPNY